MIIPASIRIAAIIRTAIVVSAIITEVEIIAVIGAPIAIAPIPGPGIVAAIAITRPGIVITVIGICKTLVCCGLTICMTGVIFSWLIGKLLAILVTGTRLPIAGFKGCLIWIGCDAPRQQKETGA